MNPSFVLWLEFEQYPGGYPGPDDDPRCDFCNAQFTVAGSIYDLNIWTFDYLESSRRFAEDGSMRAVPASYVVPPDLLVEQLDRATISSAVEELLRLGLPDAWQPIVS